MKTIFNKARNVPNFFKYFLDNCFKKYPPREYFWKVCSTVEPDNFKRSYQNELSRFLSEALFRWTSELNSNTMMLTLVAQLKKITTDQIGNWIKLSMASGDWVLKKED